MSLKYIIVIAISIGVFSSGFIFGDKTSFASHKDIIGLLLTLSAIIFGVMGAWLSITKIEIQQGIDNARSNTEADNLMKRARGLIEPLTTASLVLIFSIIFIFIQPILVSMNLAVEVKDFLRPFSFAILSVMGYCLGCIIVQGAEFLLALSHQNQELRLGRG
ncbi:MAG: hypothetical protein ACJA2G_000735 [Cognaticolwellia sp.]|jgi:hypothetical protein